MYKLWMTQCGWISLCTTVAIRVTITNIWELFFYGVKRDHYDKFIGIREFLERIAIDCFCNTFTTDTGDPEKNIPSLDGIDKKTLCKPVRDFTIPVLLLIIQISAQCQISRSLLLRLLLLAIRLQRKLNWRGGGRI